MKLLKTMIITLLVSSVLLMIYAGYLGVQDPRCAGALLLAMLFGFTGLAGVITYDRCHHV